MQAVVSFERGLHPFERTAIAQELVLTELFAACRTNGVMLEGCLLQTSITAPGAERYSSSTLRNELWSADQARLSAEPGAAAVAREALSADAVNEVAKRELLAVPKATVRTLQRTVPPSVPGILFTSREASPRRSVVLPLRDQQGAAARRLEPRACTARCSRRRCARTRRPRSPTTRRVRAGRESAR